MRFRPVHLVIDELALHTSKTFVRVASWRLVPDEPVEDPVEDFAGVAPCQAATPSLHSRERDEL